MDRPPSRKSRLLIAVFIYPDGGGISSIIENLVAAIGNAYDVHMAIVDERPGRREQLSLPDSRVHVLGSRPLLKPYLMPTSLAFSARVGLFLRRLVRQLSPAALLAQDGLFLPVPGLLATRSTPTQLIVMDHGTLTNSLDPKWQRSFPAQLPHGKQELFRLGFALDRPWRALRWRIGLRLADDVWFVGEELKPWIAAAGGRGRQYKQIVPPDYSPPNAAQRAAAREVFDLPPDGVVVNMVNRLNFEKGMDVAVRALSHVLPEHPQARVVVAGEGPLRKTLERDISAAGLGASIRLIGKLDRADVRRLHHASDLFLYAGTISCGMSIALLEAMAAGVVPIVSDVPAQQRELVGDAGWVYPADMPDELIRSLRSALAAPPERLEQLRRRSVRRVAEFSRPSLPDLIEGLFPTS